MFDKQGLGLEGRTRSPDVQNYSGITGCILCRASKGPQVTGNPNSTKRPPPTKTPRSTKKPLQTTKISHSMMKNTELTQMLQVKTPQSAKIIGKQKNV